VRNWSAKNLHTTLSTTLSILRISLSVRDNL